MVYCLVWASTLRYALQHKPVRIWRGTLSHTTIPAQTASLQRSQHVSILLRLGFREFTMFQIKSLLPWALKTSISRWAFMVSFLKSCVKASEAWLFSQGDYTHTINKVQADDTLYMLDYIGPSGFALEACNHAGRYIGCKRLTITVQIIFPGCLQTAFK